MRFKGILVLAIVSFTCCLASREARQETLVAFMCNKPAVYLTENGWQEDRTTDCLEDPTEILDFCRKVYPDREITNVVEGNELATVDNWCGFDVTKCHKHNQHTVRPFRCLVGPFQSDALLVPEHCVFDHKHGSKCGRYMDWNQTALDACQKNNMRLDSFAMLQPCLPEVDVFNGVEFVCCPVGQTQDRPFIVEDDSNLFKQPVVDEQPSIWEPIPKSDPNDIKSNLPVSNSVAQEPVKLTNEVEETNVYATYITQERGKEYYNEHEYFLKAKADMEKHHHDRVTSMMRDWASARQRVADMKVIDPKGAETLEKDITDRFQKTYEALEQEGMEEKEQLQALHQQRVQSELNGKKRDAMEHYMQVLVDPNPDANVIVKALRHYVKSEEKDRLHSLNHFRHIQESIDPNDIHELETVREQALDHMEIINQRIQQAIDMLSRVPNMQEKIRQEIAEYMETFQDLDRAIATSLLTLPTIKPEEPELPIKPEIVPISEQAQTYEEIGDELLERVEAEDKDEVVEKEEIELEPELHHIPLEHDGGNGFGLDVFAGDRDDVFDDETMEDERDLTVHEMPNAIHADNMRNDKMNLKVMDNPKLEMSRSKNRNAVYGPSTSAGIAVAAIAVFVILVVGVLLLRRKNSRSTRGFIEVDQTASPEERHVANMQMNGYENPTYKYFEKSANA